VDDGKKLPAGKGRTEGRSDLSSLTGTRQWGSGGYGVAGRAEGLVMIYQSIGDTSRFTVANTRNIEIPALIACPCQAAALEICRVIVQDICE
jgi:hypothetical protein